MPEMRFNEDGDKLFYENDQLHRLDGPAVTTYDGNKYWYRWGKRHREDGPACEYIGGSVCYYFDGHPHRLDGPAIIWADGVEIYYIHGKEFTEQEFRLHPETHMEDTMPPEPEKELTFGEELAKLSAPTNVEKATTTEIQNCISGFKRELRLVASTGTRMVPVGLIFHYASWHGMKLSALIREEAHEDAIRHAVFALTGQGINYNEGTKTLHW